jgi:hypothetical protein
MWGRGINDNDVGSANSRDPSTDNNPNANSQADIDNDDGNNDNADPYINDCGNSDLGADGGTLADTGADRDAYADTNNHPRAGRIYAYVPGVWERPTAARKI